MADVLRVNPLAGYQVGNVGFFDASTLDTSQDVRGFLLQWELPRRNETYVLGCLPDGELVRTQIGEKPIESVSRDDLLLDADGNYVAIREVMRRSYDGEILTIRPYGGRPVSFTPEHPILCTRRIQNSHDRRSGIKGEPFDWKRADELKNDMWIRFPLPRVHALSGREMMAYWPKLDIRVDYRVDPACVIDEDFWWLVGLWLADGYVSFANHGATINFCLHIHNDRHNIERVHRVVRRLWDKPCHDSVKGNVVEVGFSCVEFGTFLTEQFGKGAANKRIAHWVKSIPQEFRMALVEGYWEGDGCIETNRLLNFVSVSSRLLHDFQDVLLTLGIYGGVRVMREERNDHMIRGRSLHTQRTYEMNVSGEKGYELLRRWNALTDTFKRPRKKVMRRYSYIEDGWLYTRIHSITRSHYKGFVNNFETESHSYCAGIITTHNCDPTVGRTGWSPQNVTSDDRRIDNAAIEVLRVGKQRIISEGGEKRLVRDPDVQVAEYAAPIDPIAFAHVINAVGKLYRGDAEDDGCLVNLEVAPGPGIATLPELYSRLGYTNIYVQPYLDSLSQKRTIDFGWRTTQQSKQLLWTKSIRHMWMDGVRINSSFLLEEMVDATSEKFIALRRPSSGPTHDDRFFALCLAIWASHSWSMQQDDVEQTSVKPIGSSMPEHQKTLISAADAAARDAELWDTMLEQ